MADIRQAAKWMREGNTVRRAMYADLWWVCPYEPDRLTFSVVTSDGGERELRTVDLLAEDWEIAE